jgi:hypothetical protein
VASSDGENNMGFTLTYNPGGYVAPTVPLIMFAWIPIVLYLFSRFPAQKAVVISFLTAWMFLPEASLTLLGLPDYTKMSATCYGVLLATFIYDVGRFSSFRFGWIDMPMAVWCVCPFISSITNGLGAYDGLAAALSQTVTWGIPYFLGRIYLNSLLGLKQLATGLFVGGLVYAPLCLYESRMSPQLHRIVYGDFSFSDFGQSIRLGGFRPLVFMRHGLTVAAFMMAATLIGIWLWRSGTLKQLWGIPIEWLVGALFTSFVLMRSTGAYFLLMVGLGLLVSSRYFRTALPLYTLIAVICAYLFVNAGSGSYVTDQIIDAFSGLLPPDRIQSLEFRFNNEEILSEKARERLLFGWGGWGRALVDLDEFGNVTVQDSLWIIAFGHHGIVGLVSMTLSMLLPVTALAWLRYPARLWSHPKVASVAVLLVIITLYMVDSLFNAHLNPIYVLAIGGVAGLVLKPEKLRSSATNRSVAAGALAVQR